MEKSRRSKSFEPRQGPIQPELSPDGRFIVYSLLSGTAPDRRIFIIDVNGQNERDVVKLAGMNMQPDLVSGWDPAAVLEQSDGEFGGELHPVVGCCR